MNSPYQELDAFARLGAESVRVQVELGRWVVLLGEKQIQIIQIIQNG